MVTLIDPTDNKSGIPSELDTKWYGVPPKGERPIPGKWRYILEILGVILIEFVLWGLYRYYSAPYIWPYGSVKFYIAHIIAAPTISLTPILLYWKYVRKEKGLPFTFTKKLLMSGVLIGFTSAILWRFIETFTYDSIAVMAGGYAPGTFRFYSELDAMTLSLFGIMTFVQFFVVGPVEELEFRGFAHDQSSRVLPKWQALIFSSILFGLSHIPIAITIYRMPVNQILVAELGWMSAGFTFGALYMWSRNIFACIVMHGMGNWQLSVFFFSSRLTVEGMPIMTDLAIQSLTSIIVNTIMVFIFYLIFKYYWDPHRRGEAAFGGKFLKLQKYIFEHDFERRPVKSTSVQLAMYCIIVCGLIVGATFAVGETDFSKMMSSSKESGKVNLKSMMELKEQITNTNTLNEGNTETITINSEHTKYIKSVTITITWTDEADIQRIRTYQNQPDTFSVTINGLNGTAHDEGANPQGGEGEISANLTFDDDTISNSILKNGDDYNVTVDITLVTAGDYIAQGPGLYSIPDNGNQYDYELVIVWLVPKK